MDYEFSRLEAIDPELAALCRKEYQSGKPKRHRLIKTPKHDRHADNIRADEDQHARWLYDRQHAPPDGESGAEDTAQADS